MAHSDATKDKIRKALLGNKNSKGVKHSDETKEKIRQTKLGSKNHNFGKPAHNKGKKLPLSQRKKMSKARMGKSPWNKGGKGLQKNINMSGLIKGRGWNKGKRKPEHLCVSSKNARLRRSPEYSLWRTSVFKRDNFTCIWCGCKKQIEADHIKPFAYFPELRFCIDNGRTLCKPCHRTTETYGFRGKENILNKCGV